MKCIYCDGCEYILCEDGEERECLACSLPSDQAGYSASNRIADIKAELAEACPGETFKAAAKFEAEIMANRFMDRCAELIEILESR